MRTYYNAWNVKVTSEYVTIGDRRYPVSHLHEISTSRGPVNRMVIHTLRGGISLVAMAIPLSVVMPVAMTAALALTGLLAVGAAFVLTHTLPREVTLWATFHGVDELLMQTDNSIEVGKLDRALRRALEQWNAARFPVLSH